MHLFWTIFMSIIFGIGLYACNTQNIILTYGTAIAVGIYSMFFVVQAINLSEHYPHMTFKTFVYLFFVKGYNHYGIQN